MAGEIDTTSAVPPAAGEAGQGQGGSPLGSGSLNSAARGCGGAEGMDRDIGGFIENKTQTVNHGAGAILFVNGLATMKESGQGVDGGSISRRVQGAEPIAIIRATRFVQNSPTSKISQSGTRRSRLSAIRVVDALINIHGGAVNVTGKLSHGRSNEILAELINMQGHIGLGKGHINTLLGADRQRAVTLRYVTGRHSRP